MIPADLARAIAHGELLLHYQPVLDLPSGRIRGVEALVRWQHPDQGMVAPLEFIGLAESHGLIDALTHEVISMALTQWQRWQEHAFTPQLAINISAMNLAQIDFPDIVAALCHERAVPCQQITVELTESATEDAVNMMDTLARLRLRGFKSAIDDFGTGFSSLVQLRDLPFSEMKIDRSFVMTADSSKADLVIVKAIIDLAHNLSLGVIAEGVENETVLDLLRELGCDAAQGYHIARPMSGDDLLTWLGGWQACPRGSSSLSAG
jgi:EAL domain-containing protein (putative c-di-GMP-specific phosphodiesterase class I)